MVTFEVIAGQLYLAVMIARLACLVARTVIPLMSACGDIEVDPVGGNIYYSTLLTTSGSETY